MRRKRRRVPPVKHQRDRPHLIGPKGTTGGKKKKERTSHRRCLSCKWKERGIKKLRRNIRGVFEQGTANREK